MATFTYAAIAGWPRTLHPHSDSSSRRPVEWNLKNRKPSLCSLGYLGNFISLDQVLNANKLSTIYFHYRHRTRGVTRRTFSALRTALLSSATTGQGSNKNIINRVPLLFFFPLFVCKLLCTRCFVIWWFLCHTFSLNRIHHLNIIFIQSIMLLLLKYYPFYKLFCLFLNF